MRQKLIITTRGSNKLIEKLKIKKKEKHTIIKHFYNYVSKYVLRLNFSPKMYPKVS